MVNGGQLPLIWSCAIDLQAGDIVASKTGAKNAPIGIGANLEPLKLVLSKIPVLTTPSYPQASMGGDRVSFDFRAGPIEAGIDTLDAAILACLAFSSRISFLINLVI